jgi:GT2 family glycosyltransferase
VVDVRVGIVSWNTAALLDRCLGALPAALDGVDAEVVVVDNASDDDSAETARGHDGTTVIVNDENVGYARAMNQALAGAGADVLIALNPDTEPAPGTLSALVAELRARPDVGVVVPRLQNTDGSTQHSVHRFPSLGSAVVSGLVPPRWQRGRLGRRWWLESARPIDRSGPIDWAIGAVHVIRSAALEGRAPYSERWFMYVEDIEVCWRLRQQRWLTWLDAEVSVTHVGNASGAQAWGAGRAPRFWRASYDFVAQSRGRLYARAWALVNTTAVVLHWAANRLRAVAGPDRDRRRHVAGEMRSLLPVHARAVLKGPPPPE